MVVLRTALSIKRRPGRICELSTTERSQSRLLHRTLIHQRAIQPGEIFEAGHLGAGKFSFGGPPHFLEDI